MFNILDRVKQDYLSITDESADDSLNRYIISVTNQIEDYCKQPIEQITLDTTNDYTVLGKQQSWLYNNYSGMGDSYNNYDVAKDVKLNYTTAIPLTVNSIKTLYKFDGTIATLVQGYQKDWYYEQEDYLHKVHFNNRINPRKYIYTFNLTVGFDSTSVPEVILDTACKLVAWKYFESQGGKGLLNMNVVNSQLQGQITSNITYGNLWNTIQGDLTMYHKLTTG